MKREIKQQDLAERLNISRSALSNYERGRREIPLETAMEIAKLLNLNLNELICNRLFFRERKAG